MSAWVSCDPVGQCWLVMTLLYVGLILRLPGSLLELLWVLGSSLVLTGLLVARFRWAWSALPSRLFKEAFLCPECLEFGDCHQHLEIACRACDKVIGSFPLHYGPYCPRCDKLLVSNGRLLSQRLKVTCKRCSRSTTLEVWRHPVRVLGTLTSADFEALRTATDATEGKAHGVHFFSVIQGENRIYVLNLADLANTEELLPLTHAARAVEAIWLSGSEADVLAHGLVIDRFLRRTGLTRARCQATKVYVAEAALPPAAHRLLDTRLGTIRFEVAAADFLPHAALADQALSVEH
jgi:hypothetical protein